MRQIYIQSFFRSGYNRFMNYIYNVSNHPKRKLIEKRLEIIKFFDEFGEKATKIAFGKSRSVVYLWKQNIKNLGGKLSALAPESTRPKYLRESKVDYRIKEYVKDYRNEHPGVSKETIYPELMEYCLENNLLIISESTIGRVIKELKEKGKLPQHLKLSYYARTGKLKVKYRKKIKKLRRKDYQPENAGDLMQIDAIELMIDGTKRYILTAIDVYAKYAFAFAYKSLSSASACDFMEKLIQVVPFNISHIQTDNGKEFHKYFALYIQNQKIIHFYNYPKCPKMNAFIENFNGLIQRQFVDWHYHDLKDDVNNFNVNLVEYLLWYNTKKQHSAIGKIPPLRYYVNTLISKLNLPPLLATQKSNMLWTSARDCESRYNKG